jgi:hypothetical protein
MSWNRCISLTAAGRATVLCLIVTPVLLAQLTDATLKGTVTDASGGVVPGAYVVVTNENTGQTRSATTSQSGEFSLPNLPPGAYDIKVSVSGFKTFSQRRLELNVGRLTEINARLELGEAKQTVEVRSQVGSVAVSNEGRISDTLEKTQIAELPIPQRDLFFLPSLSAGATDIPGPAFSFKLTNSPTVTINGNRYRGNNYVLDGSIDTDTINGGEPAIVPSLESVEEVQVQTGNFSSEYGRGNGSVVNIQTKSGTNELHGKLWEYHKNAGLNARNFFAAERPPQVFNQFGGNVGGPIARNRTFFFASYEGTRNSVGDPLSFQVETPEFRDYVFNTNPSSVAASLLKRFPAPTPAPGSGGQEYQGEVDLMTPQGAVIPALGTVFYTLHDAMHDDQYMARLDHLFNTGKDTLTGRWISEYEGDNGATNYSPVVLGEAVRGFRDPFHGFFGNLNVGETHVFNNMVNDARFSFPVISIGYQKSQPQVPQIFVTGVTASWGDPYSYSEWGVRNRTYEGRDTLSVVRGGHTLRTGFEVRNIFEGINLSSALDDFYFNGVFDFAADNPYAQYVVVNPVTGTPAGLDHYYSFLESALFLQDDWKATHRLTLNFGIRNDSFGTPSERYGHLSSIIWGPGSDFRERLANASVAHVSQLYEPERVNLAPRIGLAYDPFGNGKTSVRAGYSIAYQPPNGYFVDGAFANPPDTAQLYVQPNVGIGSSILYGIPAPANPTFKTTLNAQGGIVSPPGQISALISPWVVNPNYKAQYSESWFFNLQWEFAPSWILELGYAGTNGINLERMDDINRFAGDLIVNHGNQARINPNFGAMTYVTNGVTSSFNGLTAEVRHQWGRGLMLQANYRWSKWLDDSSDGSPGLFADNPELNPGAQNVDCLRCERGPSMFDIPHRFTASAVWVPEFFKGRSLVDKVGANWQLSTIIAAQSGRPFSVWCSASFQAGCDFNADGGGAQFGGSYDRPDAPASGTIKSSFSKQDYLNGLFNPNVFPRPTPGTEGTLGRDTFRGPHQVSVDLAVARSFRVRESKELQIRFEAFNALNNVNLYLPNSDMALALRPDGTFSPTSSFGVSTQAFDPRILQVSARFAF